MVSFPFEGRQNRPRPDARPEGGNSNGRHPRQQMTRGRPEKPMTEGASSTLLGRVVEWAVAEVACAGHGCEQGLQLAEYGVEGQAGAAAFGSRRSRVAKAWASTVRVTWRCQPTYERASKWSMPRAVLSSR